MSQPTGTMERDDAIRCLAELLIVVAADARVDLNTLAQTVLVRIANTEEFTP